MAARIATISRRRCDGNTYPFGEGTEAASEVVSNQAYLDAVLQKLRRIRINWTLKPWSKRRHWRSSWPARCRCRPELVIVFGPKLCMIHSFAPPPSKKLSIC